MRMKLIVIIFPLLPLASQALSIAATDEDPVREATELKLSWLDNLRMELQLADSSQHIVLLSPASNLLNEPTPCLFSGALEQDLRSVVAVTGCSDSTETAVTIASRLVPGGLVDLVIINGTTHTIREEASPRSRMKAGDEDMMIAPANANPSVLPLASDSAIPSQVILKTYITYDNTLLRKLGGSHTSTKQWLSRVVEMARPRLAHSSLNTAIKLQLLGEITHLNEDIQADRSTIFRLARSPKEKGLVSNFCSQLGGGVVGIAFLGTACRQDGYAVNINECYTRTNTEVTTARVWVHELGHNIGMSHDFDSKHGGQRGHCNNKGLMSYGNAPDKWSTCSNADFADWFRKEGNTCIKSNCQDCSAPNSGYISRGNSVAGGCSGCSSTGWLDCANKCAANNKCAAWYLQKSTNKCWLKASYQAIGSHGDWSWGLPCKVGGCDGGNGGGDGGGDGEGECLGANQFQEQILEMKQIMQEVKMDVLALRGALVKEETMEMEGASCQNAASKGKDYSGKVAETKGGHMCKVWKDTSKASVGEHNYCRNPSSGSGVWCYTKSGSPRWDYCAVPTCGIGCQNKAKKGTDYSGEAGTTSGGFTCKKWSDTKYSSLGEQAFCRNPSSSSGGVWCYTTDPSKRWQYCDVPDC